MRRWAGRPLLGTGAVAVAQRRWAWILLVACALVVFAIGAAFARQTTADGLDRLLDDPVIRLLGGHARLLTLMEEPGTQVPAVVLSLAMAVLCLGARRLNGVVLAITAVFIATRLDEWLLKPLFHRTYLGALSYPSGHTTSVVAIIACYVVLFLLPPQDPRTRPWRVLGLVVLLALAASTVLGVIGLRWHYFTDTVGGAAVAVATVCALCLLLDSAWRYLRRLPSVSQDHR
jgi:membrane-associated phospholipid phosphatase